MTTGRHGCDDHRSEMLIEFIWRYDQARSRLADLASDSRIQPNEVDIAPSDRPAPYRHRHSLLSKWLDVGASNN